MSVTLAQQIQQHCEALGIELESSQYSQLAAYAEVLWSWNEKMNLTRHTTAEQFAGRDLLDSFELSKLLSEGEEVLDLGTGGGVPGIPLKIMRPDLTVVVCDSVGKKAEAVEQMVKQLGLDVEVFKGRGEERLEDSRFDAVVARAVGPLRKLLNMLSENWFEAGRLLAIKGPKWPEERSEARAKGLMGDLQLRKAAEYTMPGTGAASVILKIWPEGAPEK
jgi:16S rRNA (guanine527-N7)-methyltransferase